MAKMKVTWNAVLLSRGQLFKKNSWLLLLLLVQSINHSISSVHLICLQAFQYTLLNEFRQDEACLDVSQSFSGAKITFYGCHELKGNQEFKYTEVRVTQAESKVL